MKKIALLLFLLFLPLQAQAQYATDEQLEENTRRDRAWEAYQEGIRDNNPARAIGHFLKARANWKTEGPIKLYKIIKVRVGVVPKKKLKEMPPPPGKITFRYNPTFEIFNRYDILKRIARRRSELLPKPRNPAMINRLFKEVFAILVKLRRHQVDPVRVTKETEANKTLIEALLKKPEPKKPDPIPEKKPDPEEKPDPEKKPDSKPTKPEIKPEPGIITPSFEERLRIKKLELQVKVEEVKALTGAGQRALKQGLLDQAVAAIDSATIILVTKIAPYPPLDKVSFDAVAQVSSMSFTLHRQATNMLAVSAAVVSSESLTIRRERFIAGLETARDVGAGLWSRIQQQKMVARLLFLSYKGRGVTSLDLKEWQKVFDDPICKAVLKLEIEDEALSEEDECTLWPFPRGSAIKSYGNRYVLSQSIRALTLVEESWNDRQNDAPPEGRRSSIRQLLANLEVLTRAKGLEGLEKEVRERLSKARRALQEELVQLVFILFKDSDKPTERFASYLLLLPKLEEALDLESRAKILVGLGLAGLNKTGDEAPFWLVDRGLALDSEVIDKLPKEVPQWAVAKARKRKKAKNGAF